MRYWKHLELGNFLTIKRKALEFLSTNPVVQSRKVFWVTLDVDAFSKAVPELNEALAPYGVHATYVAAIVVNAPKIISIHIDAAERLKARLQLPLMNTLGTRTTFYTTTGEPTLMRNAAGTPYYGIDPSTCTEVDSVCINRPTILRVSQPHDVVVPEGAKLPRIALTVALNIDPVRWLDESE